MCVRTVCSWWQDLSPGSVEEAEEAEPDDEFKDAIEVNTVLNFFVYLSLTSPPASFYIICDLFYVFLVHFLQYKT